MTLKEPPPPRGEEMLQVGSDRASWLDRLPPVWRQRARLLAACAVGVACGAGVASWWTDQRFDPPSAVAEDQGSGATRQAPDVRLVLTGVRSGADAGDGPLTIDGVLLHGRGSGTATVTDISRPGRAIDIRTPALPVTLSVNRSFERIRLRLSPRDCALATEWTPSSQPFAVTWEDQAGVTRSELGGDHDAALEIAMTGYLDVACDDVGR